MPAAIRSRSDFLSFWSAGQLALAGHAGAAYDWPAMHVLQHQLMGHDRGGLLRLGLSAAVSLRRHPSGADALCSVFPGLDRRHIGALRRGDDAHRPRSRRRAARLRRARRLGLRDGGAERISLRRPDRGVLLQLEARPLLAGLLLGLLTYKPHFGLLFPIALMFGGYWRALFAAVGRDARHSASVLADDPRQPRRLRRAIWAI